MQSARHALLRSVVLIALVGTTGCKVDVPDVNGPVIFQCRSPEDCADGYTCDFLGVPPGSPGQCKKSGANDPCATYTCAPDTSCVPDPSGTSATCVTCAQFSCPDGYTCARSVIIDGSADALCVPSCGTVGSSCQRSVPNDGVCASVQGWPEPGGQQGTVPVCAVCVDLTCVDCQAASGTAATWQEATYCADGAGAPCDLYPATGGCNDGSACVTGICPDDNACDNNCNVTTELCWQNPATCHPRACGAASDCPIIASKQWQCTASSCQPPPPSWYELGDSAANGIPGSVGASAFDLAVDSNGNPVVVWEKLVSGYSHIYASRWTGTGWQDVATAGTSIDQAPFAATAPAIAGAASGGFIIAWSHQIAAGSQGIYVARWDSSYARTSFDDTAMSIYSTSNMGVAITGNGAATPRLALDDIGNPFVIWSENDSNGFSQIYLRHWTGNTWEAIAGSATAGGISNYPPTTAPNPQLMGHSPDIAQRSGAPFVTWIERPSSGNSVVITSYFKSAAWTPLEGVYSGTSVGDTRVELAGDDAIWLAFYTGASIRVSTGIYDGAGGYTFTNPVERFDTQQPGLTRRVGGKMMLSWNPTSGSNNALLEYYDPPPLGWQGIDGSSTGSGVSFPPAGTTFWQPTPQQPVAATGGTSANGRLCVAWLAGYTGSTTAVRLRCHTP
ncbi:MAG: hypothetical protein AAB426_02245 [Myxococcota bacterium]|mgnify:CR=1 FL=1